MKNDDYRLKRIYIYSIRSGSSSIFTFKWEEKEPRESQRISIIIAIGSLGEEIEFIFIIPCPEEEDKWTIHLETSWGISKGISKSIVNLCWKEIQKFNWPAQWTKTNFRWNWAWELTFDVIPFNSSSLRGNIPLIIKKPLKSINMRMERNRTSRNGLINWVEEGIKSCG